MKVVIIFNHPYDGSYCYAVLNAVLAGLTKGNHEPDLIHLDKEGFNPVMTATDLAAFVEAKREQGKGLPVASRGLDPKVLEYQRRLQQADHLVFIFPIWWELMPALMKGFIDKVIFPGIAYEYGAGGRSMRPKFRKVRGVTLITTMNTPSLLYRWLFGNAIQKAFFTGTFWKTGYKNRKWISLNRVKFVSEEKRQKWLVAIEKRFARLEG